jgi:hypothetical protein
MDCCILQVAEGMAGAVCWLGILPLNEWVGQCHVTGCRRTMNDPKSFEWGYQGCILGVADDNGELHEI